MELMEKVSYLKGLMDGLDIDTTTKEGKILLAMADVLKEMSDTIYDISDEVDEVIELVDILDKDLGDVEEEVFNFDDECSCGCGSDCQCDSDCSCGCNADEDDEDGFDDDEELYECVCPTCGDTICLGENIIAEGSINCPNCNEKLEFSFEDEEDEEETKE